EGELSVLLHGWLDHAGSFDLLAPLLPGRTVALDFRGHGDSQWVGPGGFYHFVEYIADLDGVLEALSPQEPVSISTEEIPARLASYLDDLRRTPRRRRRVESAEDAAQRLLRNNTSLSEKAARLLAAGGVGPDPEQENALAWKWDPLLRAHSPLPISEPVVQLICAQATVPILMIRGERGMLPPESELRARFTHLKMSVHTVAGTGHHAHLDAPEAVAKLIEAAWHR